MRRDTDDFFLVSKLTVSITQSSHIMTHAIVDLKKFFFRYQTQNFLNVTFVPIVSPRMIKGPSKTRSLALKPSSSKPGFA